MQDSKRGDEVLELVAHIAEAKAEHRGILMQIASDEGMSPETRSLLVSHVLDEEEGYVLKLQGMLQGGGPAASSSTKAATGVGSDNAAATCAAQSVPSQAVAAGTVGDMRSWSDRASHLVDKSMAEKVAPVGLSFDRAQGEFRGESTGKSAEASIGNLRAER